jgi:transposase
MPRTCTICTHEQRREIDRAVVSGESYRGIARHFAVSEDAIERHKKAHLSAQVVKAAERREERRADSWVDQIEALLSRAKALLDEVFPEKRQDGQKIQPRDVAAALREMRETLLLMGRMTGQLKGDGATVNVGIGVLSSPEWGRVAAVVTGALLPYPEARAAVVDALAGLSDGERS